MNGRIIFMEMVMNRFKWAAVAAGCAVVLAGCGGASDGADTTPKTVASSVKVFGDSIMDSGTFGYKFTIQGNNTDGKPIQVFPEIVAANFGVPTLCAFFNFSPTAGFTTKSSCTNYAVGGGRVNNLTNPGTGGNASPFSITYQLGVAAATPGALTANDVVIVDGGGNDLADLTGAYLGITASATGFATYTGLLGTMLPQATIGSILGAAPTPTSLATAGGAYAQALGTALATSVKTNVVGKGVSKVVVVTAPDITATPRFLAVLAGVAAQAGTAQRDAVKTLVDTWTNAFNAALVAGLAGTSVQVFDLNAEGKKISANPTQFAFTNIVTPACPKVAGGIDSVTGQASLTGPTVAACNTALMSAPSGIPVGETSSTWWQNYAYSDNFHPTPALHKLIAQSINLQLVKAGWL
jgi:phospholipase/lecithinase/hemolysin